MDEKQDDTPAELPAKKKDRTTTWIALGIAALIAACAFGGVFSPNRVADNDPTDACRDWVKQELKAPATAGFSGESKDLDGDVYTVTGSVDAENSFGAKLRSSYVCKVRDAGDEWRKVSVTVG